MNVTSHYYLKAAEHDTFGMTKQVGALLDFVSSAVRNVAYAETKLCILSGVVTKRKRSRIQAAEMGFLRRVSGLSLKPSLCFCVTLTA